MAEVDTSSYPRPQPAQNPLDTIVKFGQAADQIGNIEAGKAVQGAIGPDGEIDRNALAQSLKGTVAGSMKAIPTLSAYEALRNAGHVADQAGADNFQKRMALINHLFGQLASKENPTIQDVNGVAARVLDPALNGPKYGITFPVVMNALKNFRGPDGRPLPPAEIRKRALEIQTMTGTTAEQLGAFSPRYQIVDDGNHIRFEPVGPSINPRTPAVTKRIPTGETVVDSDPRSPTYRQTIRVPPQEAAPTQEIDRRGNVQPFKGNNPLSGAIGPSSAVIPTPVPTTAVGPGNNALSGVVPPAAGAERPATFAERFNPRMAGAPAAGLAPGVAQAATSTAEAGAQLGNQLVAAANEAPITRGVLDNLERELQTFTPGPGADYRRIGKAFANTVIPDSLKDRIGFDPKSIADQEGFNKLAYNLAQSQFQALGGTGTDAKLNSTMATSPSELLSKEGNQGIIRLLKGNNDALVAKSKAWNAWKKTNGEASYPEFSEEFNTHFNPRIFQFRYIPKKEQQSWYRSMSKEERRNFEESANYALDKGWIKEAK